MKSKPSELIESLTPMLDSLTPIFIATIGGIIGFTVIITPLESDAKWSAGIGLAGTAIAGASGLAQSGKKDDSTVPRQHQGSTVKGQEG